MQWLLPAICLIVVTGDVRGIARIIGAAVLVIAMFGLSFHFTDLVHREGYTGNTKPRYLRLSSSYRRAAETRAQAIGESDQTEYPAGWLDESAVVKNHVEDWKATTFRLNRPVISQFWHTPLTWLYRKDYAPVALWYCGGKAADVTIEIRDVQN